MMQVIVPAAELWDETKQEFVYTKGSTLQLEHSLVSISKWESKWHRSYFARQEKTLKETLDYVRCMTITQNVSPETYRCLTNENIRSISQYINDPMTATYISQKQSGGSGELVTSELIYYWMIALNIPMECQKWHLNRLLTLIRVCEIKNQPPKKRSRRDILKQNAAINAARRKQYNSRG